MINQLSGHEYRKRVLLMDRSAAGRIGAGLPNIDVPLQDMPDARHLRRDLSLPEVSEGEVVRYFTGLSQMNFSIDTNYYPLGSCTMKYNPKINDLIAGLPGFSQIHPHQPEESVQGALKLMYELQGFLCEIVGMQSSSLATMAGAQGELAGMLMIKAYHMAHGDVRRTTVLVPDSAHGTNPASAAMCGFQVVSIPSDELGNMDLDALKAACDENVAGLMLTLPNTLGLFDNNILAINNAVHDAGGLVYGDGANMNAMLGQTRLGDLGFDVLHFNLHKTFSTPHGGGGPGAGPVCANSILAPFLPSPIVDKQSIDGKEMYAFSEPNQTIGKTGAFHGNFGMLVRAYTYIRGLGSDGLKEISDNAVVNANYILNGLRDYYDLPYDRSCMHEVVFSANKQKAESVSALDVAKRLIDYGIHPPTMYFPLVVEEALMIEPTETESKETLDHFISVMRNIAYEAQHSPQILKDAPHNTPNSRLDEATAARKPNLRWLPTV